MTFSSYVFLFVFLPIVVVGYYALSRAFARQGPALVWLVAASLVFYGSLGLGYLAVLVASVLFNFAVAALMTRRPPGTGRKWLLVVGLVGNLGLLAAYKYTGFLADNINALLGTDLKPLVTVYPIGLSFYTFIQIGFLLDAYVGGVKLSFVRYTLFGTFFPYVTAGPLVRHDEIDKQMDTPLRERTNLTYVTVGLTMFAMGLFKKVVLADSIAPYATTMFGAAEGTAPIGPANAWLGMFAYALQLYFDFSGYTDMALGIAYMLGLRLPLNFNSPLKATSMVEFWRRWHMTMTRFFTTYVYTPMTASLMRRSVRSGFGFAARMLVVLMLPIVITFLLVGLWHGAGWGFVIWGAIMGVSLAVNLAWREIGANRSLPRIPSPVGWLLTIGTFVMSLAFFGATTLNGAGTVVAALFGAGATTAAAPGTFFGSSTLFGAITVVPAVVWVALLLAIALLWPRNSQQMLDRYQVGLPTIPSPEPKSRWQLRWNPNLRWATAAALVLGAGLVFAGGPSPFLYYQF